MEKFKAAGIKVIAVIPSVKIAQKMEEIGVDAVVAEGTEAGDMSEKQQRWHSFVKLFQQ